MLVIHPSIDPRDDDLNPMGCGEPQMGKIYKGSSLPPTLLFDCCVIGHHKFRGLKQYSWGLSCDAVVKTLPTNAGGVGSIPGQGAKNPTYLSAKN